MTAPRRLKIRPAKGVRVRGPDGRVLPPEGAEVPRSSFWFRRLRDGDVELVEPKKAPAKKKTTKKKKTKRDK